MTNLYNHIKDLLSQNESYCKEGKLFKNIIVEAALQLSPDLLKLIIADDQAKAHFFQDVEGVLVFDKVKFQKFVSNKQFLPDSFTAYKNKIGLTADGTYLTESKEIVLDFPYKDCVLEGGQTKEDQKRRETFWNETLAPDEIDRLLDPKHLTNWKKYDENGVGEIDQLSIKDNLVLKGNNLLALHSLLKVYRGRVKLIYIDPPYNTGKDDFGYNDRFNHSAWMTFIKNRLEVAKELLHSYGSIWINIDDNESHYLKVLGDSVFNRENFVQNIIWQKKFSPQNDARYFSDNHDHILVYAKNKTSWKLNLLPRSEEAISRYKNPDKDPRGPWVSGDLTVKTYNKVYDYPITTPSGNIINPPKGVCWRVAEAKFFNLVKDNRVWFGKEGSNVPRLKRFLSDVKDGTTPISIWPHSEVGHNQEAKQHINATLESSLFSTPKPERLLNRIIHIGSSEGDIILDFFAGSGTTAAVAHKMGRQFITCEQMDYVEDVTISRLKKVLEGEQGGVSKTLDWNGGGSFIYAELAESNQAYINAIHKSTTTDQLLDLWSSMKKTGFLNYNIDSSSIDESISDFKELNLDDQKRFLISTLDKNQLYINYSERNNKDYDIKKEDIKLSEQFYNLK